MNLFSLFRKHEKTAADNRPDRDGTVVENLNNYDYFSIFNSETLFGDSYLYNAWVNIAVNILTRNIARADFTIKKGGNDVKTGSLYDLFRRPNAVLSRYDLWKETAAWWHLEGEAFWWFGPDYAGGLPAEIYLLNPRKLRHEEEGPGALRDNFKNNNRRWFYYSGTELIPILQDELIHFRDWNPWNPARGVNPLVSLALELEQDYYANKANSQLLKNLFPLGSFPAVWPCGLSGTARSPISACGMTAMRNFTGGLMRYGGGRRIYRLTCGV
jgi:phage portal protein BeeE